MVKYVKRSVNEKVEEDDMVDTY